MAWEEKVRHASKGGLQALPACTAGIEELNTAVPQVGAAALLPPRALLGEGCHHRCQRLSCCKTARGLSHTSEPRRSGHVTCHTSIYAATYRMKDHFLAIGAR